MNIFRLTVVILFAIFVSACSMVTPFYSSSQRNVQQLESIDAKIRIGSFNAAVDPLNFNPINIRAGRLQSPYQDSFVEYLKEALKTELVEAGKFDVNSSLEVSGTLIKNNIQIPVFEMGYGLIEARFIVKQNGKEIYNKTLHENHSFESAFSGSVAYSKAIIEYKYMVQKLMHKFLSDPDFALAAKKS